MEGSLTLDSNDMHAHDLVEVVNEFDLFMDDEKDNLNADFTSVEPLHDFTKEEGEVEMSLDEDVFTASEHDLGKEEMTLESKQYVSIDMECALVESKDKKLDMMNASMATSLNDSHAFDSMDNMDIEQAMLYHKKSL